MKRKAQTIASKSESSKNKRSRTALSDDEAQSRFRFGLFDRKVLDGYTKEYGSSDPYKHAVIHELVDDSLLRRVRDEIRHNVSFTPKETDIYKIHQSGDLANLDGLDDAALAKLPSLLALRDAMYSESFRHYVSHITGCGSLSGRKTDMAINVYTPGSYLLCHDDVIGSRKVSYILYLTDPDVPWKPEWGGALRLYPVEEHRGDNGQVAKTPSPSFTKVIPPAWNQLSFFAVQPGESFHDVEEVYHAPDDAGLARDAGRVRMAISGWFHIPQPGEDGFAPGAEEKLAKNSSLMQLQGNPDQYDAPAARPVPVDKPSDASLDALDESDLDFLVKYLAPTYLTPDALEQVADHFDENSSITLPNILSKKFAARLKDYVEGQEKEKKQKQQQNETNSDWSVANPPHKHRYLYQHPTGPDELRTSQDESPVTELLDTLLPSRQFRLWLQTATGCVIESHDVLARRFRRGQDYTLATGHDGKPRLELNLGFTPSSGWGDEDEDEGVPEGQGNDDAETEAEVEAGTGTDTNNSAKGKGKAKNKANGDAESRDKEKGKGKATAVEDKDDETAKGDEEEEEGEEVGGVEVYMAGDDGADDAEDEADGDGEGARQQSKKDKDDAAIYRSSGDEDNILFFQAPAWNKMTLVLRDSDTLRFVKYVSRKAPGDRWDVSANFEVEEQDLPPDEEGEGAMPVGAGPAGVDVEEDDDEEEFTGFSDDESESD